MQTTKKIILTILLTVLIGLSFTSCVTVEEKEDPNFLGDFDGQGVAKMLVGNVRLIKGGIKPLEITFSFYPRNNILVAYFRNKGRSWDAVYLNFDQNNRELITQAIHKFLEAYNNQTLTVDDNKKKAFFGKTKITLAWGALGAAREARPTLRCEYELLTDNRPYFIIGNAIAKAKDGADCPSVRMAFSPSQCEDLLEILKQDNLVKIVDNLKKEFNKYDTKNKEGKKTKNELEQKEETTINYN